MSLGLEHHTDNEDEGGGGGVILRWCAFGWG